MSDSAYIAVVDDEPSITRLLTFLIERSLGMATRVFNDSATALKELPAEADRLLLVICDLRMPEVDGLQLCRHLRATGARYPLLLLTAFFSEEMEAEARRIGVNEVVQKPFRPQEFLAQISALIGSTAA